MPYPSRILLYSVHERLENLRRILKQVFIPNLLLDPPPLSLASAETFSSLIRGPLFLGRLHLPKNQFGIASVHHALQVREPSRPLESSPSISGSHIITSPMMADSKRARKEKKETKWEEICEENSIWTANMLGTGPSRRKGDSGLLG